MRTERDNGVCHCPLISDELLDWFMLPCAALPYGNPRKMSKILKSSGFLIDFDIFTEYLP